MHLSDAAICFLIVGVPGMAAIVFALIPMTSAIQRLLMTLLHIAIAVYLQELACIYVLKESLFLANFKLKSQYFKNIALRVVN